MQSLSEKSGGEKGKKDQQLSKSRNPIEVLHPTSPLPQFAF